MGLFDSLKTWQKVLAVIVALAAIGIGYYLDFQYRKWIVKSAIQEAGQTDTE